MNRTMWDLRKIQSQSDNKFFSNPFFSGNYPVMGIGYILQNIIAASS